MVAILMTVALVMLSTAIALSIGFPWGLSLYACTNAVDSPCSGGFPFARFAKRVNLFVSWGSMFMTLVLPLYVHAAGWESFLGKFGWLPMLVGGERFWFFGMPAAAWIHGIYGACWVGIATWFGLYRIPSDLIEAALIVQSKFWVLRSVVLPAVLPWVAAGLGISALVAATEMPVADLYGVTTLSDEVYKRYALSPETTPVLQAILIPIALTMGVTLIVRRAMRGTGEFDFASLRGRPSSSDLGLLSQGRLGVMVAFTVLTLTNVLVGGAPLVSLGMKAGWKVTGGSVATGHEFSAIEAIRCVLLAPSAFRSEIVWSLVLGTCSVVVAVPAACLVSWGVTRLERSRSAFARATGPPWISLGAMTGMTGMLVIPGPVLSLAVIWVFNRQSLGFLYDRTLLPTICVLLPKTLPLAYFFVRASQGKGRDRIQEAGRLDSGSAWLRFRFLELPRYRDSLVLAGAAVFFSALADVSATLLVLPPSVSTIAVRLFGLMHSGVRNQEAGLGLITIFIVGFLAFLVLGLLRYKRTGRSTGKR